MGFSPDHFHGHVDDCKIAEHAGHQGVGKPLFDRLADFVGYGAGGDIKLDAVSRARRLRGHLQRKGGIVALVADYAIEREIT